MKKIINNPISLTILAIGLLCSCGDKKQKQAPSASATEILQQVDTVVAIGKVIPTDGWTVISATTAGQIKQLLVKEGDAIQAGEVLIKLNDVNSVLEVNQAKAKLSTIQAQHKTTLQDLRIAELSLQDAATKYNTSKSLHDKGAETKEKMDTDYASWKQEEQQVARIKQRIVADQLLVREQQLLLDKAGLSQQDLQVKALKGGIIAELTAELGQQVSANDALGKIINTQQITVEAEVDELFAPRIQVGQEVTFFSMGTKQLIGKGHITYASPTLLNKSILYETNNEGDDRRVRKIKIKPLDNQQLLINTKVSCQIKLK